MPAPFGRAWSFNEIPGLEQEVDRIYWMLGQMWEKRQSASEVGNRRMSRNKGLDDAIGGELTAKSLRVGRTRDSIPIERIETFVVTTGEVIVPANGHNTLSVSDVDYPQLSGLRRGTLWNLYLDPGNEDLIVTSRIAHADSGDDNGTLKVELFNTTGGGITLSAGGKAYFTVVTPRSFE